jgi:hypothetical protein
MRRSFVGQEAGRRDANRASRGPRATRPIIGADLRQPGESRRRSVITTRPDMEGCPDRVEGAQNGGARWPPRAATDPALGVVPVPCRAETEHRRRVQPSRSFGTPPPSIFYHRVVSLEWEQTIVDAQDPSGLGTWWREALGWVVVNDRPDEFEIRPAADRVPGLLFVPVSDQKTMKNRLHLDFRPDDRDGEVERLLALGATRAGIGQGEQSWVVLADPEGNEFCVLGSRAS